jgi:hypothetical protein
MNITETTIEVCYVLAITRFICKNYIYQCWVCIFCKTFDKISVKYDNVILIGDLNYNVSDEDKGTPLTTMCDIFDYTNLVKTATCA